ncbi:tyrosine-type recombinase/integrase [Oceanobacillus profundus]|uniref:tyrosine-type recombinase/integrase n=1 Tax=Oceanobacillus profundus TaxID=372463 RepID=UPI0026E2708E|nr:site-specific integrase [Oceanobacillus profundus]MDO6450553.1 site-specific integrase [Oceanobacillus profundus]
MPIKKNNYGSYNVDISIGIDPITGKRRRLTRTVETKKEAEDLYYQLSQKYNRGKEIGTRNLSFKTVTEIYLEECKLHAKPNYYQNQCYLIQKHLKEQFKNSNLKKVTKDDIKDYQQKLINSGLRNKSINNIMITLKRVFETALEANVIHTNPCNGVKNLSLNKEQMKFWTPDQFKEFITLIDDKNEFLFKTYYTVAYLTGMRCGELLALNWNDIDSFQREINVYKSLTYIDKKVIITEPKTRNSIRRISINSKLLKLLNTWKEKQKNLFKKYSLEHSNNVHVFQYREKAPTKDIFSRRIKTICERGELTPIRQHDLRHSHVALLIHQREDYTTIKERLGHASIKTTIDVYGHLFPNKQKETADRLDDLF